MCKNKTIFFVTEPYKLPVFIRFRMDGNGICVESTCAYTCKGLDYNISSCESTTICHCAKFRCLNCEDERDIENTSIAVDAKPWDDEGKFGFS